MRTLLKSLSLVLLLTTAGLFVLKLEPGKAERLAASEIVEAGSLLVFGVTLAVLTFFVGARLGATATGGDEQLDDVVESVATARQAIEQVGRRLDVLEASVRGVLARVDAIERSPSPPKQSVSTPSQPLADPPQPDAAAVDELDFAREREKIESLMSIARWDDALSAAERLAGEFPDRPEAAVMLDRVRRERSVFVEGLAERLYEQVKQASARRQWRRAHSAARRLVEEVPAHRRAVKVRAMLDTLAANAEVEERQEREEQIQLMIRSHRLPEAIELSEQLIAEYPRSPQARSLRELLPKLRERLGET